MDVQVLDHDLVAATSPAYRDQVAELLMAP
ncbi:hypothetical protein EES41_35840 [Streptomyces sp. ADI95-16]|nr:hypothetical protein EES41_35840 [Streptomyces sp. ADI95-16]